jgi:spore germination protein
MAIAPINQVKRVLDYAVTAIPSEKILMGMPNTAMTGPAIQMRTAARSLSNTQAIDLAVSVGAEIEYDKQPDTPYSLLL